jgi:hypothetical protein
LVTTNLGRVEEVIELLGWLRRVEGKELIHPLILAFLSLRKVLSLVPVAHAWRVSYYTRGGRWFDEW